MFHICYDAAANAYARRRHGAGEIPRLAIRSRSVASNLSTDSASVPGGQRGSDAAAKANAAAEANAPAHHDAAGDSLGIRSGLSDLDLSDYSDDDRPVKARTSAATGAATSLPSPAKEPEQSTSPMTGVLATASDDAPLENEQSGALIAATIPPRKQDHESNDDGDDYDDSYGHTYPFPSSPESEFKPDPSSSSAGSESEVESDAHEAEALEPAPAVWPPNQKTQARKRRGTPLWRGSRGARAGAGARTQGKRKAAAAVAGAESQDSEEEDGGVSLSRKKRRFAA